MDFVVIVEIIVTCFLITISFNPITNIMYVVVIEFVIDF